MELQEDCYRIKQVLPNVASKDIIKFLRTKVPLIHTELRCQLALQHFLNLEDSLINIEQNNQDDIKADYLCIRHLINCASDEEIHEVLNILGPIPDRKLIAVKLLLRENSKTLYRKKRKNDKETDTCEASSSKLVKFNKIEHNNGVEQLVQLVVDEATQKQEPLKLTIKSVKDRNGNDKFMVTSPTKTRSEPKSSQSETEEISTTTDNWETIIEISDPVLSPVDNKLTSAVIGSTTEELQNELPSTSSSVQNKAGPYFFSSGNLCFSNLEYQSFGKEPQNNFELSLPIAQAAPSATSRPIDAVASISTTQELTAQPSTSNFVEPDEGVDLSSDVSKVQISNKANENQNLVQEVVDLSQVVDENLVFKIVELFPKASSDYIRQVCAGKEWSEHNFSEIVTVILATEETYPRRPERQPSPPKEIDPEEQFNTLKELLKDVDPSYLHEKLDQFAGNQIALENFIDDALQNKNYPTLKEYQRKQQLSAQQRQYTTEFNVERFVELFPDPVSTFEDPNRKTTILDQPDKYYVKWFMRNKYNQLYAKDVNSIVESEGNKNIISIVKALKECVSKGCLKRSRWVAHSRPDTQNIPLLQELAYFEHKDQICSHIENKKKEADLERKNAKELDLLQACSCCYDEEVMPNDILTCSGGCRFCRDCIRKGTEVAFGEGKLVFPCLMDCGAEFSLHVLQNVLPPKVFSKLAQKKAVAEVKAAGIEELETCPFCDFASIPSPDDKLFRCLNPDCMKESCRLCKEPSHLPLRCNEVEKDEAVKARTYIEDKMTEALIRQCWKCNAKFIKEEGCNKMTCSCGALMCYVCRKPVKDYKHFNGQGGDRHDLCPLYTDNFSVNEKNVLQAAADAKKQVDPTQLKNDPTADLQIHFGDKIKEAERKAKMNRPVAPGGLPQVRQQEVQRLRDELREQLRLVQELHRNDRNQVVEGLARWGPIHHIVGNYRHAPPAQPPLAPQPPPQQRVNADVRINVPVPPNRNVPPNDLIARPRYAAAAPARAPFRDQANGNM